MADQTLMLLMATDAVTLALALGGYVYTMRVNEKMASKAEKKEVDQLGIGMAHITERIDHIYDYLVLNGGMKEVKKSREKEGES
jgi:hypothetical protein